MIAAYVEPRQPEAVLAVQVGVLTPRVPPAALVVGRAVARTVVVVAVRRAEPVTVLEGQRVRGVAAVSGHVQPVIAIAVRDGETRVVGKPTVAVDVGQLDPQGGAIVLGQPVDGVVAQPKVS